MIEDTFSENIPLKLLDPQIRFKYFLNNDENQDSEIIILVLKVIIKASENKLMEQTFREVLTMVIGTKFAVKRLDKVISVEMSAAFNKELLKLLITFLKLNFELIPGIAYDVFYNRVHNLGAVIDSLQMKTNDIDVDIINDFEELKELLKASNVPKLKQGFYRGNNRFNNMEPPDNYKYISIFPTSKDLINIKSNEVFLRGNKSTGAYTSVNHYLDVQFRLMREDFIHPLREGLNAYMHKNSIKHLNIRVFKKVYLMYALPAGKLGIVHNMSFKQSLVKKINWRQSKQFMYGSLLCFCTNNFEKLLFATVINRDVEDLKKGIITVKFHNSSPNEDEEYTLIETTNMFESYRHVLLKLQETNENNLCMKRYLVYVENNISLPKYLSEDLDLEYIFKGKHFCPGNKDMDWPSAVDLNMDESQFQAFQSALTKEMTIIQGPPGTGKTYLGLNICECLINNVQKKLPFFGPILVVCYTNHALDQFLEGISNITDKIVRIGSRCKSEKILNFSILNWKKKTLTNEFTEHKHEISKRLFHAKEEVLDKQSTLMSSKVNYIGLHKLKPFINKHHYDEVNSIGLKTWLSGESFEYRDDFDSVVEWLIYTEIMDNILRLVIDAKRECLEEIDVDDDMDQDNEVNYDNFQRRLDIDEENMENINEEFNRVLISHNKNDEFNRDFNLHDENDKIKAKWKHATTKRLFASRLKVNDVITEAEYEEIESIAFLSVNDRWRLYRYWKLKCISDLYETSDEVERRYEDLSDLLNEISFEEDRQIMERCSIIGMTTTGAARYSKVLSSIGCKIIIVEEAAEVLESHIIGSLNLKCEHLILIGDHKQLKPNPAVYELAKRYDLDISLFERLINNNLDYSTLLLQHRMRPEIAEIMGFIYKNLKNHESVYNYPNVPSVGNNLHFFDHQEVEEQVENIMSYSNRFEAEFIVKFCRHLMKNGVESTQITILTLYTGQMFLLRSILDRNIFEGVRLCVVDNYQGEENDIILLSLVRSNEFEKIGFLSIENRICVCLSRAKQGFYVFGNFQILTNQNERWKEICQFLKRKEMLSGELHLFCQNHPEKKMTILKPNDFNNSPEGGCKELCNKRLACGHACRKSCHFLNKNHENNACLERCTKSCPNEHRCNLKCWERCKECTHLIEKSIAECNHKQVMECGKEPSRDCCKIMCERVLGCGHKCTKLCKEKCEPCLIDVEKMSSNCDHIGEYKCSDMDIICKKSCETILGCGHKCSGTCGTCYMGRLHKTCQSDCKAQLICGHVCDAKCSRHCPSCPRRCEEGCSHNSCPNFCGDDCVSCYEECQWKCKHKICHKLCYEICDRSACEKFCNSFVICKECKCRFLCYGVCGEKCNLICFNCGPEILEIFFGTEDDKAMFITLWTCGHSFEVTSMDTFMNTLPDDGEVVTKKCPRCNTIINKRSCFRYLNIVKKISSDIKKVQKKIDSNVENVSDYYTKLNGCSVKISTIFQMYDMINYFTTNNRLRNFEVPRFRRSLDLICEIYDLCFSDGKIISSDYIDRCILHLIIWLNPRERKFNRFEIDQFNVEFDRIDMLLKVFEGQQETDVPLKEMSNFINELKRITFCGEVAKEFKERWNNFKKTKLDLPNMAVTDYEKKRIVKAIGLEKGRWFKCAKGHFYVIGECGGATQISKCPECDSSIGGTQHKLLGDNQFAPEIDDAIKPAYPGMRNNNTDVNN